MRLERNLMSGNDGAQTSFKAQDPTLAREDVSFFSSQMEGSTRPVAASSTSPGSNLLVDASNYMDKSKSGMSKGLTAMSKGDRQKDKDNYSSNLSDNMLLTTVLTKSVGKTAQFLEKISNLQ